MSAMSLLCCTFPITFRLVSCPIGRALKRRNQRDLDQSDQPNSLNRENKLGRGVCVDGWRFLQVVPKVQL